MGRAKTATVAPAPAANSEIADAIAAAKSAADAASAAVTAAEVDLVAKQEAAKAAPEDAALAEAVKAAEDALAEAKAAATETQLKAEALAESLTEYTLPAEIDPLHFDISETGYDLPHLIDLVKNGATLIFGYAGLSLPSVPARLTTEKDWTVTAGRIEFAGTITMLMSEGVPVTANSVALADGPDGPIRSVSALGGAVLLSPGGEYQFGPGAFVFEGVQL